MGNVRVGLSRHMPAPGLHVTGHEFRHKTTGSHPAIWTPKFGVCGRTEQVRAAIMSAVGVSDCAAVTTAQLTGVGSLDFTRMDIKSLQPDDFSGLTNLRILYLDQNKLSSLPAGVFSDLTALRVLSLGTNALSSLPDGVFSGLTALEWLWLGQNDLSSLPDSVFSDLTALESLFLFSNNLNSLPDSVFSGLTALRFLDLLFNELNSLPAGVFSGLAALEVLYLAYNELSSLPAGVFSGLTRLQQLQLQHNELSSLPEGVFSDLTALWLLYLDQNHLSSLPAGVLSGLTRLQDFHLHQNNVDPFPLAVTLEKVGSDQVRAKVLAGAPFAVGIPVTVANGALDGGPTTLRVAAGSVEGTPVTVTRKAGTTAAVTVDIDLTTQPSLPTDHYGYTFRKATSGSPTSILSAMNTAAAGAPTITGTPQVGAELTTSTSGISDVDGLANADFAYQWIRADGDISGATGSTYTIVAADEDERLKVRISFSDDAGSAESLTSAAMAPVWPAPANPPLEDGEEELLSATMTLGWHQFPLWVSGYGRVRGESFGEMDVTSFEDGGATYIIDAFLVNSRGVFGLATGSTRPDASGLVAYWNGYRISGLEAYTSNSGRSPPMLMGRTPQPSTEYSRYEGEASDGIRVAVSLRRAGPPDEAPLTAEFRDMPETHDGESTFTLRIAFSEPLSWMNGRRLREDVVAVAGGRATSASRVNRRRDLWELTVEPDSPSDVTVTVAAGAACGTPAAVCTKDGRALSETISATVRGPAGSSAASAPMKEDLAARACSALAGGDGLAPGAAAAALWRDGDMDNDQLAALDSMGNGNGTYDLGDLLAWINRCRPGSGSAAGAGPPPAAPPALPASQPAGGASQRRKGARGPARRRRAAPDPPAAGSRTRRFGWLRTALLAALIAASGCGDGIVDPRADAPRHDGAKAAVVDPGPLHVRLTAPPQARDIGAMLVIEGPAIDWVQAPGLEMFETDESSSTRREVIIAGALPDGPVLRVWVPHRGDHARYRVRLLQVAAEDFALGDPEDYTVTIGR